MCKVRVGTHGECGKSLRGFDMFWTVFWIVNLARGCGCEGGDRVQAVRLAPAEASGAPEQKDQVDGGGRKEGESELLGLLVRLMAANRKKAQELAFEGFISLAHLMCRVLIPRGRTERRRRASRDSSLFRFIVNQPQVADLLTRMLDPHLIDHILKESAQKLERFPRGNVDCIQVLTCKTKPFVGGMQRALRFFMDRDSASYPAAMAPRPRAGGLRDEVSGEGACSERGTGGSCPQNEAKAAWEEAGLEDRFYFFMPTLREVLQHGDRCDQLFPNCLY